MSKSTKFHFKVVGDDYISKKDSLVKQYASVSHICVQIAPTLTSTLH